MATYHLNIRRCSKNRGQSAKAKSDYINREDKYTNRLNDVRYQQSGNMPAFAQNDPAKFWESADIYERANARVCTEIVIALPRELNLEQQKSLVNDFIDSTINNEQHKLPYSLAIHNDTENHNPHCHIIFSERHNDGIERSEEQFFKRANSKNPERGGAKKSEYAHQKDFVQEVRTTWRKVANQHLEKNHHSSRIDERSLKEQGVNREPLRRITRIEYQYEKQLLKELGQVNKQISSVNHDIKVTRMDLDQFNAIMDKIQNLAQNPPKSSVEQLSQETLSKHQRQEKILSQVDFDDYLVKNWLKPYNEHTKASKQLEKYHQMIEDCQKQQQQTLDDFNLLKENKPRFWEFRAKKVWESKLNELSMQYQQLGKAVKDAIKTHNDYYEHTYKPLESDFKKISDEKERLLKSNPHLKDRNITQVTQICFKGAAQYEKEVLERQKQWEQRQRERELKRNLNNDFSL